MCPSNIPTPLLPGIGRSCTGTCPSMLWGHAGACLAHIPLCSGFPFVKMGARARRDCAWAGCPWGTGTGRLSCPMWWKSLTQGGHLLSSQPTAGEKVAPVLQVASGLVIPWQQSFPPLPEALPVVVRWWVFSGYSAGNLPTCPSHYLSALLE